MKLYELTYLISPEVSQEEAEKLQAKIISLIQEKGGVLVKEDPPLKKNLAYPVKNQSQAFLASINFELLQENLSDFEKVLKSESQIFRCLLLKKKKAKAVKPSRKASKPLRKIKKSKIKLKEIEKKLEEILKE